MFRAFATHLTLAVFVVFSLTAYATDLQVEGAEVGSSSITITGYDLPQPPGGSPEPTTAGAAGIGSSKLLYLLAAALIVVIHYYPYLNPSPGVSLYGTSIMWFTPTTLALTVMLQQQLREGSVLIILAPLLAAYLTLVLTSSLTADLPAPGFQVQGFSEGSTQLSITGLPDGARITSVYTMPGHEPFISYYADGDFSDDDREVNGTIVTGVPRWEGPPHVLSGEIWTLTIEDDEGSGIGVWTATGSGVRHVVPVASHVIGATGTPFISDLGLANPFGLEAEGWIRFVAEGAAWEQGPQTAFKLEPGQTLSYADVLKNALDITTNTKGTVLIGGMPAWNLSVTSKNYAVDSEGRRFGIAVPGERTLEALAPETLWVIPGLRQDAQNRSNLILAGSVPSTSRVQVRLFDQGQLVATEVFDVPGFGLKQINRLAPTMGVPTVTDGYVELLVLEGAVHAGLSVVDGTADDAAYRTPESVTPLR